MTSGHEAGAFRNQKEVIFLSVNCVSGVYCCITNHSKTQQFQQLIFLACYFTAQEFCKGSAVRFSLLHLASPGVAGAGGFISTMATSFTRAAPGCPLASPHNVSFSKASLRGLGLWLSQVHYMFYAGWLSRDRRQKILDQ